MLKAKLSGFAFACIIGLFSFIPCTAFAAEADTETTPLFEKEKDDQDKVRALEDKMIAATEKWNALSKKQKNEVYALMEKEMKAKFKVMDVYVKLGIILEEDAEHMKGRMKEKFNEIKECGDLPLLKYRVKKHKDN